MISTAPCFCLCSIVRLSSSPGYIALAQSHSRCSKREVNSLVHFCHFGLYTRKSLICLQTYSSVLSESLTIQITSLNSSTYLIVPVSKLASCRLDHQSMFSGISQSVQQDMQHADICINLHDLSSLSHEFSFVHLLSLLSRAHGSTVGATGWG